MNHSLRLIDDEKLIQLLSDACKLGLDAEFIEIIWEEIILRGLNEQTSILNSLL